jgi:outer membrane autotransporter protein
VGTQLELVHVSGGTDPSVFVAGDVLGISPRDFLSMGMTLSSQPEQGAKAGTNGGSYLLNVKTHVEGLNAAGVLASSAALGVDSLMTSTIGSWRDRSYSLAATGNQPAFATIVPWVRGFRDEGGMNPDHLAGNFGQLSNARVSQDNFGTEMGLELQALNGFRFGTLFAKSEGKQYLVEERGMDTIRGSTLGLYGTWVSQNGFFVDASWRTMQFDADIDSAGGRQRSDGHAVTTNLEAGYTWKLGNGLNIEPQLRYTSTSIDGLRIQGDQATFESQDAQWKRASAGFSLWKTFGGGSGWRWTPYGEVSLMQTIEGVASYTINDDYFGNVMTEGTSALVKFGLGAQKGRFSWNGGFNWMDGATYSDAFGGQMSLQYAW